MSDSRQSPWRHAQVGIQWMVCVLLGFAAGWWLDKKTGFAPWLTLAFSIAGIALGFYLVIREVTEDK